MFSFKSQKGGDTVPSIQLFGGPRLPMIAQVEAAECAVACLAMIAGHFGFHTTLSELRRRFSVSLKGTSLKSLIDMADSLGLAARPLRLEIEEIHRLKCPAILHWELKHYVVLRSVGRRRIIIHDPARGIRSMSVAEFCRSFTGIALELTPVPGFEVQRLAEKVRYRDLLSNTRVLIPSIVQVFALTLLLQLFALFMPILNQIVVDEAINRGDVDLITLIGVGMILLLVISSSIDALRGFISLYFGTQLSFNLTSNLLRHTLKLPVSWYEKRHIGDVLSRFESMKALEPIFTSTVSKMLLNGLMFLVALGMMVLYSPYLAALELVSLIVFLAVRSALFPYAKMKTQEGIYREARVETVFLETLRGARTFKLFGKEQERIVVWQNERAHAINTSVQLSKFRIFGDFGTSIIQGAQSVIIWFIGARSVVHGDITLGMLLAFKAYSEQFSSAAIGLASEVFSIRAARVHLERLADVIHADIEKGIDRKSSSAFELEGSISIRALSFRYADHEPYVLKNISMEIKAGEFVCLTGPSGHGKTTLLKLMLGFSDPTSGAVLFDGVEMRQAGIRNLRDNIGVVMQDDQLFGGTIGENISFFDPDADQDAVEEAAKSARIHDDILQLPMGYLTYVGDMGSTLSSGQKQRVLIARALYRKPRILFLDEGTSNLDPENERKIMDVVRSLPITRVVIAHREAAAEGATTTFDVKDGGVLCVAADSDISLKQVTA